MDQVVVHIGRTVILPVSFGYDISEYTHTSEIRAEKNVNSDLLATWDVDFLTDGTDGELVLTLDNSETSDISKTIGYMDIKRMSSGEPMSVFDEPLEVYFVNPITA